MKIMKIRHANYGGILIKTISYTYKSYTFIGILMKVLLYLINKCVEIITLLSLLVREYR
jgi:hypothetical protein